MLKPFAKAGPRRGEKAPITYHLSLITMVMLLACAGCAAVQPKVNESNYLTYDHPFTDAAAQAVMQNAGKICAERKQGAIKTSSVCSLKQCTTHYQCVDKAAAGTWK